MATYKPLQSLTLSADTATAVFSNIDQSYTDLRVVLSGKPTSDNITYRLQFNGDSSSGLYSFTTMGATSGGQVTYRYSSYNYLNTFIMNGALSTSISNVTLDIQSYQDTNTFKSCLIRSNDGNSEVQLIGGVWRSTSAINSITVYSSSGSLAAGTTLSLYGIKAGTPKAIGGDITTTDGTYWYHAFKTSGSFTVQQSSALSADVLIVAGGGGGGCDIGGGGGAGGVLGFVSQTITGGTTTAVTVGAGGIGAAAGSGAKGSSGVNSQFGFLTASVGGGGGGGNQGGANGVNGGSGGGAGYSNGSAGQATSGQGNNGGSSLGNGAAGGGGYGSVGTNGTSGNNNGGAGGSSTSTVTNLSSVSGWLTATGLGVSGTFAGGGGGASGANTTGGAGGGGGAGAGASNSGNNSSNAALGGSATANTGSGGGGGSSYAGSGGAGGSGFVIVRYAV